MTASPGHRVKALRARMHTHPNRGARVMPQPAPLILPRSRCRSLENETYEPERQKSSLPGVRARIGRVSTAREISRKRCLASIVVPPGLIQVDRDVDLIGLLVRLRPPRPRAAGRTILRRWCSAWRAALVFERPTLSESALAARAAAYAFGALTYAGA